MSPSFSSDSGIRDNHARGSVGDFLKQKIQSGSKLSIVSAYFTIYAFQALQGRLESIDELRFLFGEPRFVSALDPEKPDKKSFKIEDDGLALQNRLQQKLAAKARAAWIRERSATRKRSMSPAPGSRADQLVQAPLNTQEDTDERYTIRGRYSPRRSQRHRAPPGAVPPGLAPGG